MAALAALGGLALAGCRKHAPPGPPPTGAASAPSPPPPPPPVAHEDEDEDDDHPPLNLWRVEVRIVGHGALATPHGELACQATGGAATGRCGPELLRFAELDPPLLRATGARGWRFDRWTAELHRRDGTTTPRPAPLPDGRLYLNGLGYVDDGTRETVTAIFVPAGAAPDDLAADAAAGRAP
jgi:hypothetical protein